MFEYWSRPDIHTFGNMGVGGALHAAMAPIATKVRGEAASPLHTSLCFMILIHTFFAVLSRSLIIKLTGE